MNEKTITVLREGRTALQFLVEPIDQFVRWMNYKKGYPPLHIRQKVGSLNDFEGSGGEYMAYLKLLCDLEPGMNVLDIGCGCGLMCLPINENPTLPEYLSSGKYIGMDTNLELIHWCRKNIKGENVSFNWIGKKFQRTAKWYLEGTDSSFDVILCKSLFTHLLPKVTEDYLDEIKRLLQLRGRGLATFFLMDEVRPKGRYTFRYQGDTNAYYLEKESNPEAAVAYNEDWLLPKLKELGFSYEIYYGSWRGDNKGLSFQDIIILRREVK